jgi:hypothetical protein
VVDVKVDPTIIIGTILLAVVVAWLVLTSGSRYAI